MCGGVLDPTLPLVVLVLASASLLPVSAAVETVLIFDDLGPPDDTVFTDQYADQGVIFSPQDGELQLRTASTPVFPEDPQGLAEIPYFTSVIIADFEHPPVSPGHGSTSEASASAS